MDEFIFELKEHSAGLNCGRWDCKPPLIHLWRLLTPSQCYA
jgi:malate synthase